MGKRVSIAVLVFRVLMLLAVVGAGFFVAVKAIGLPAALAIYAAVGLYVGLAVRRGVQQRRAES